MDILKDEQYKEYENISRYTSFPTYYNTVDDKYIYGLTGHLSQDIEYVGHKVTSIDTLDSLSQYYYGRPDYFWIIADFNHISDPFVKLSDKFTTIKIPTLSDIKFDIN